MDPETEREIWRRVRQNDRLNAEEILLPEKLEESIQERQMLTDLLVRTAQSLSKGERTALLRISAQLRSDIRELTTLHYLLTGRRLKLPPGQLPPKAPIREELRALYFRFRRAAKNSDLLSKDFSEYEKEFREDAQVLRRAERTIAGILKGKLR